MLWPLYLKGAQGTQLDRRLGRNEIQPECCEEEKNPLPLHGIKPEFSTVRHRKRYKVSLREKMVARSTYVFDRLPLRGSFSSPSTNSSGIP
jgi:hypothetical protein